MDNRIQIKYTAHHSFEIGELLKERGYDDSYVVMIMQKCKAHSETYDILVVRTDSRSPEFPVGDIVNGRMFSPEHWEKLDV